ncbi:MAG: thioredoxin-dependent thiol peroxidase [Petrimonas sp.]|jgi:peroxiredoxin Q/BCP|uniref:thioredoxin-dependent peroxiredoxin n=1 Tax=bioreactor metagenome TaxID=1076179 RepID=A0A644YF17_9ZZZZ|nr:thioredoxin-dependent thiol peroxidase [Petrimonas sp.]NLU28968.1 thioredoxin-dependent thiol peroxidase [Bacteroidales bacterium]BBD46441.1 bacterioferritin comigratory protein [Petrimonas sp. IBARAKI]HAC72555.1 thioredoxin-dependent thiol peroxidase [Porphyromonadaceae bacterium]MDD2910963.1 thioredoxin-dependent thiol peroxidase [Petrimonas sp.]
MALQIGDKIPEILGTGQDGKTVKSTDFTGKKLALYFYPKDNTPGCTAQACSLRDGYQDLKKAGYAVVGVSVDSEDSHRKFIEKFDLPFPLIADVDKKLVQEFGVWQEKKNYGKTYMGTVRTTFLIDEAGIIRHIIEGRGVDTKNHAEQILNL